MHYLRHHPVIAVCAFLIALSAASLSGCDSGSDLNATADEDVATNTNDLSNNSSDDNSSSDRSRDASNGASKNNSIVKRGQYVYFADAATFTDCNTSQSWPVASSAEAANIERAYLEATRPKDGIEGQPMQPITITIETHIDVVEGMEAGTKKPLLVIDRFIGIDEDQSCDLPQAELVGTYWRLDRVTHFDVMPEGLREEARIILAADGNMKGHSGCNAMFGQYTQHDDTLKFSGIAGTRMACPNIMPLESAFHLALSNTGSYRIDGQKLFLETESGQPLASLEAVYLY